MEAASVSVNEGMLEALKTCKYEDTMTGDKFWFDFDKVEQAITNATSAKPDNRDAIIARLKDAIKTIKFATCRSSIPDLNFNAEELEDLQGASGTQQKYILLERYIKRIAEQTLAQVENLEKQS